MLGLTFRISCARILILLSVGDVVWLSDEICGEILEFLVSPGFISKLDVSFDLTWWHMVVYKDHTYNNGKASTSTTLSLHAALLVLHFQRTPLGSTCVCAGRTGRTFLHTSTQSSVSEISLKLLREKVTSKAESRYRISANL